MKKMYACLKCGFVHEGKTERVREDYAPYDSDLFPRKKGCDCDSAYHGYATYMTCPECGEKHCIKSEPDPGPLDPGYDDTQDEWLNREEAWKW